MSSFARTRFLLSSRREEVRLEDFLFKSLGSFTLVRPLSRGATHEAFVRPSPRGANSVSSGRFDQRVTLPFSVEANGAQAKLTNGVLEVRLPRLESDKPRKIAINGQDQ